jgi:L-ascorbate metabolism protein UlaG (beta-lactamase superfamily)
MLQKECLVKVIILLVSILCFQSCSSAKIVKNRKDIKAPFDGKRFNNIEPFDDKSFWTVLKWRFTSETAEWDDVENQEFYKPSVQRSMDLKLTMIGHSTVLIQVDNINILTDPQYSNRSSVVSWAGPKRVIQPSIKLEDLPPIDLVLISHNHYDHLDLPTLRSLSKKDAPVILVGLGNNELLKEEGIKNVVELDWWDKYDFKGLPIHFTPVQHWSARGLFDKRMTLWGGFYIEANKKIFFAGDTGYGKVFKMIHEKYGDMDVGLIPIGAYAPRWFMKNAHINPDEAVKIFKDLKLKKGFGVHFATFKDLTDEPKEEPAQLLKQALKKYGINEDDFIAPKFGPVYKY